MNSNDFFNINKQKATIDNYNEYIPMEQTYIENIIRLNKGKKVCIYQNFPYGEEKSFTGIIENCGKDHIILSNPNTGKWYLLLMIYVSYIDFDEEINTLKQFYSSIPKNY